MWNRTNMDEDSKLCVSYYSHPSPPAVFQLDLFETVSLSLSLSLQKAGSRQEVERLETDSEATASLGRVLVASCRCLRSFITEGPALSSDVLKFRVSANS